MVVNKIISKSQEFFNRKSSSILSAAGIIAISYLASALLGLIRNHLLAARFFGGLEADLDVYFAAFVIPDTLFQLLVVGAVSAAFIPIYQEYINKSEKEANEMANTALTSIGGILLLLTIIIIIFARPLAGALTHFSPEKLDLMANLIRIMSIAQVLFTLSSFLTGVLQSQRRFLIPAIAPLLYNFGTIFGVYFFSSQFGIYSAAFGVVLGAFLHMLIQLPVAKNLGYLPKIVFNPKHPGVISMMKLMPPRTIALGMDQIERAVAVNIISYFSAGSLAIFNFARQLYVLPISIFGVSLSQACFPALAEEAGAKNYSKFKQTLAKSILQVFFFALPASVLVLVLRIPLVRIAFGARTFPWEATLLTGRALAVLALSIAPQSVTQILTRSMHALKDTKTPLVIGIITMIFFVSIAYVLSNVFHLDVVAVTAAMSIGNLIDFAISYFVVRHKVGSLEISGRISKMLFVSFLTGISLWIPFKFLDQFVFDTTRTAPLIGLTLITSGVGFSVYLFFCWLMKVEELSDVLLLAKKLGNWRKILVSADEVLEAPNSSD